MTIVYVMTVVIHACSARIVLLMPISSFFISVYFAAVC